MNEVLFSCRPGRPPADERWLAFKGTIFLKFYLRGISHISGPGVGTLEQICYTAVRDIFSKPRSTRRNGHAHTLFVLSGDTVSQYRTKLSIRQNPILTVSEY